MSRVAFCAGSCKLVEFKAQRVRLLADAFWVEIGSKWTFLTDCSNKFSAKRITRLFLGFDAFSGWGDFITVKTAGTGSTQGVWGLTQWIYNFADTKSVKERSWGASDTEIDWEVPLCAERVGVLLDCCLETDSFWREFISYPAAKTLAVRGIEFLAWRVSQGADTLVVEEGTLGAA